MDLIKSFLILSISTFALRLLIRRYCRGIQLPPGPRGLPILGNLLQVKAKRKEPLHITYFNWSQDYGDVFTLNTLGSRTVVLNSYEAIIELLGHRSHNYSDRPRQAMVTELVRWYWHFGIMRYSESWRLHRKTFHQSFSPKIVSQYYSIQRERTTTLIKKLVTSPKDFFQHVRMHSGGITLEVIYGYHIRDTNDPYIKLAGDAMVGINATAIHGKYLVDYIPLLKYIPAWFPGASFKAKAELWARDADRLKDIPWTFLKKSMREGTAVPCFSTRNMEKFGISPTSKDNLAMEEVIQNCAGAALQAGVETTVSSILSFILAMVLNPQIQDKAQKEIDEVIGSSRLPDFDDRENLPYVNAILAETLRWKPVGPLAVPRRVMNDDVYDGYLIPGGSVIIANIWAVLQDEILFGPDTKSFNPDRFLKQDGKSLPPDPELLAFGVGRRICPGRHLAVNSIWLAMTYLLTSFTMAKEVDGKGKEIDPVVEYSDGLVSYPTPFNCRFLPRSSSTLL